MIPFICQIKHDPPEKYGDCLRAVIASLLEIEPLEVPHFADNGRTFDETMRELRTYLNAMGVGGIWLTQYDASVSHEYIMQCIGELNPGIYYLLFSADHVVICMNDRIVHDPAWYRTSLTTPAEAWVVGVLTHDPSD